jgi:hypothetical protein
MTLCRNFFVDDLTDDPSLDRPTLPGRVLGTNRRDFDDCGHLYRHWLLWCGCGFCGRDVSGVLLTRSWLPAGPSFWDQGILTVIGLEKVKWISDGSKHRPERYLHGIWSGRPRVQYIYEVGEYVTLSCSPYLSATFLREYRLAELYNVPDQLFKRLQESATERTEPIYTAAVFASIPGRRCFCRSFGYRTQAWKIPRSSTPSRWCRFCVPGVSCSRIKWEGSSSRTSPRPSSLCWTTRGYGA